MTATRREWTLTLRRALIETYMRLGLPDYQEYDETVLGLEFITYVKYVGVNYYDTVVPFSWDDFMRCLDVRLNDGTLWTWHIDHYRHPGDFLLQMTQLEE